MSGSERKPPAGGLPPANLGAVFGDSQRERRGRLSSVPLAPQRPAERAVPPAAAEPAATPAVPERELVDDQAAEQAAPDPVELGPVVDVDQAEQAGDDVDQAATRATRQLIVYMPTQLRARLRRAAVGSTQLDVMLDAVERTERAGELGQLVAQHQAPDTGGLFERRPARGAESNVQVNVRARHQHTEVLDRLATRYGTNRSELIRVALDHVLPGGPRRRR